MTADGRTFLVECYLPSVAADEVAAASERARTVVDALRAAGRDVAYLGAMFAAAEEVAFHVFVALDRDVVDEASRAARLDFERITESIAMPAGEGGLDPRALLARPAEGTAAGHDRTEVAT